MMQSKFGVDAFALKIIAIVAMVVDHVGYIIFPNIEILRVIGRITFPIMAFFIAEGFHYTRDIIKYAKRLLIFAVFTTIPFFLAFGWPFNVLFTMLGGLMALYVAKNQKSAVVRFLTTFGIALLTLFCDWGFIGVWLIYIIGRTKNRYVGVGLGIFVAMLLCVIENHAFNIASIHMTFGWESFKWSELSLTQIDWKSQAYVLGMLLSMPLIFMYNGKRGIPAKNLFYWFYPGHLLVITAIYWIIQGGIRIDFAI